MAKMHIKTGDNVVVLSGEDKGVQGEVIAVSPEEGKVIVKGVNIIHKHVKPRRQGTQLFIAKTSTFFKKGLLLMDFIRSVALS